MAQPMVNQKYDVVETARLAGNFRVFVQALEATGLADILTKTGLFTVFAPVDEAFERLPKAKLENLFRIENRDSLRSTLMNHVLAEKLFSADLKQRDEIISLKGEKLSIESRVGLWVNEGQVINPDLEASNGVIHGIATVLLTNTHVALNNRGATVDG